MGKAWSAAIRAFWRSAAPQISSADPRVDTGRRSGRRIPGSYRADDDGKSALTGSEGLSVGLTGPGEGTKGPDTRIASLRGAMRRLGPAPNLLRPR